MILGIAADLSAPPSSPTSFRELAMIAKADRGYDVIALCDEDWEVATYRRWFRIYGLFDYVDDLMPRAELAGQLTVEIEGGCGTRLTAHNLRLIIAHL